MRALLLLAALCAPARAWNPFVFQADPRMRPIQALSDAGKASEVVAALNPSFIESVRGNDVRQAYVLLGDSLASLGRYDEALGVFQLGVGLFPKNVDLLTRQAGLLHKAGLDERARPLFLEAIHYEPKHFGAHLGLAEIERALGSLDRAAQHYEAALESLDRRGDVWRDYAEVLLGNNELRTADLALRKALSLEPANPQNHLLLAFARRAQGDLPGAVGSLDEALALGAGVGARRAKALWLIEAEKPVLAAAVAAAVLKEAPGDAVGLWVKARALLAAGDKKGADAVLASLQAESEEGALPLRAAGALRRAIAK